MHAKVSQIALSINYMLASHFTETTLPLPLNDSQMFPDIGISTMIAQALITIYKALVLVTKRYTHVENR